MDNSSNVTVTNTQISSIAINEESDTNSDGVEVYNPNINNFSHPFWRTVFSVQNGTGSTSKVATLSIVWVTLGVLIYLVAITHGIPDHIMLLSYFSSLLICVIYSPAKIIELLQSRFGNTKK
jgi:hypothetical protein